MQVRVSKTYTGLPFTYEVRKGRNGDYTRELWIDRRENSKSLALSSVLLALRNIKKVGAVVDRPKALGDIRGVSYIYGMFYRFGLIDVPDTARQKIEVHRILFFRRKGMNKKRNVDSGRKSARPDHIQKTISQKSSGKCRGKVIKTGGIIILVLLLGFAGNKFFLSVSKNRQREGEGRISFRCR